MFTITLNIDFVPVSSGFDLAVVHEVEERDRSSSGGGFRGSRSRRGRVQEERGEFFLADGAGGVWFSRSVEVGDGETAVESHLNERDTERKETMWRA